MKKNEQKNIIQNLSNQVVSLREDKNILETQVIEINKLVADLFISQNHLEALNKAQMNFIANISHELRSPLNAIIGFAQVMNNEVFGPIENKNYKEYINFILSSSEHLLSLINDVLDLSKIQADRMFLYETNVNIETLLLEVLSLAKQFSKNNNRTIKLHLSQKIIIKADEKLLRQIFLNKLSNAVKFTNIDGKIDIFVKKTSFGIRFIFQDNGIGIPKEKINHLFEPFMQIENVLSRSHDGTGLGLVLVKKMVILHSGNIEIKSIFKKGTKVIIDFPKKRIVSIGDKDENM